MISWSEVRTSHLQKVGKRVALDQDLRKHLTLRSDKLPCPNAPPCPSQLCLWLHMCPLKCHLSLSSVSYSSKLSKSQEGAVGGDCRELQPVHFVFETQLVLWDWALKHAIWHDPQVLVAAGTWLVPARELLRVEVKSHMSGHRCVLCWLRDQGCNNFFPLHSENPLPSSS